MSIKYKLIITYLLAGLLPMCAVGAFIYMTSTKAFERGANEILEATMDNKKDTVIRYVDTLKNQITTFSHSLSTVEAANEFKRSYYSFSQENGYSKADQDSHHAAMANFINNEFGKKYHDETKGDFGASSVLNSYNDTATDIQYNYIAQNSNPLGSKHLLDGASDKSRYTHWHKLFHPVFREYLDKYHLYDIFLVDVETGDVVYTVFKEIDFASNLTSGYQVNSGLAAAFQRAKELTDPNAVALVDYQNYIPSYGAPASFIASPVWDNGKKVAVAIFQVPIDQINAIMKDREGLGETGESYLVGSDGLLRSDTYLGKDNYNVVSSFKNPTEFKVDTEAAKLAVEKEGTLTSKNYMGKEVLSVVFPINVEGLKWGIIAEKSTAEAFADISTLKMIVFTVAGISALLLFLLAFFIATGMSRSISTIAERLSQSAGEMSKSSSHISQTSTELSETSTEQAASLQETVSSIDEISSMVQRNADAATKSADVSMQSTQVVARGKQTVDNMIDSIADISASNENIITCMQKSNEDISKIVNVISEIGEKTKVINDIVFQTKLLSFNASVEAARAGEHGKGFAVVAEEVGNLAAMSGKAALEITEMLERSTKQVTDIVGQTKSTVDSLVQVGKEKIQVGTKTANECGRALDEIMKNMVSVNDMVKEIASASEEQATGVKEVTKAMQQLDQTMHQNTSVAQQSSETAKSIKTQAELLDELMGELNKVVHGKETIAKAVSAPAQQKNNRKVAATSIKKHEFKKKESRIEAPAQHLKIVGLDTEIPKQDDSRFEEL